MAAILTQPPFDASAMDGYAIRWADRAGPWRVVGEAAAGRAGAPHVGPGEAVRIFTGAAVPQGADTIVVQEEVAADGTAARLTGEGPPRQGAHIRPCGLDFAAGDAVAHTGDRLTPARLGLLAAAGHGTVAVPRRPRVVVLATGDELVPPGASPGPGQIISSGGVMLTALFAATGADVRDGGIVPDDRAALTAALRAAADADLIVTIGGASVGDHDLVRPVLAAIGAEIDFWRIAMRPGKPMLAGRLRRCAGRRAAGQSGVGVRLRAAVRRAGPACAGRRSAAAAGDGPGPAGDRAGGERRAAGLSARPARRRRRHARGTAGQQHAGDARQQHRADRPRAARTVGARGDRRRLHPA